MISVIIPTYKEPEVLDLCLKSAILGQKHNNQIIVVVDGFFFKIFLFGVSFFFVTRSALIASGSLSLLATSFINLPNI